MGEQHKKSRLINLCKSVSVTYFLTNPDTFESAITLFLFSAPLSTVEVTLTELTTALKETHREKNATNKPKTHQNLN